MRPYLLIISVLSISLSVLAQEVIPYSTIHDGEDRNYLLFVPSTYETSSIDVPLVFNFHGFTQTGLAQMNLSEMNDVAEANGFIVCYPNGIGNAWNVDWNMGSTADDIGFTALMIEEISSNYNINQGKVYACGMSNGGFFSYRLACEMPDKIAAIASVTGSFSPNMMNNCQPTRSVPIMEVHGTDDFIVPYDGSIGIAEPIEEVIQFWLNHNICTSDFEETMYPDIDTNDGSTVSQKYYQDCDEDSEVLFVIVDGGGHSWPGSSFPLPGTNKDYHASEEIWTFFNKHQLDELSSNTKLFLSDLKIYPNPVMDYLTIDRHVTALEILSNDGKRIAKSNHSTIDLRSFKAGVYFIRLKANGQWNTQKLIKL